MGVGDYHTCGIAVNGSAFCWGYNGYGEVGDGTITNRSVPTTVSGNYNFSGVDGGGYHTCGIAVNGSAFCWGYNGYGRLGDGTTTQRTTPTAVSGDYNFTAVGLGYAHTCGIATNGSMFCWGYNGYGEVGDGTTTTRNVPTAVVGGYNFSGVGIGDFHTCGLAVNGSAFCWGNNSYGQLGDGSTSNRYVPRAVSGDYNFSSLALGGWHTCGIAVNGSAFCWGYNIYGQLGNGSMSDSLVPRAVSGGYNFSSLDVGYGHSCGLEGNTALCWGVNYNGQLGRDTGRWTPTSVIRGLLLGKSSDYYALALTFGNEIVGFIDQIKLVSALTGGWHHVALSYDKGGSAKLYVDGSEVASASPRVNVYEETESVVMGQFSKGTIDEVRISNSSRGAEWVNASYLSVIDQLISYGAEGLRPTFMYNILVELVLNGTGNYVYIPNVGAVGAGNLGSNTYTSPVHHFLASYLDGTLYGLIRAYGANVTLAVSNTPSNHSLAMQSEMANRKFLLVFTKGDWKDVWKSMPSLEAGTFLTNPLPSFAYGLGRLSSVFILLNYTKLDLLQTKVYHGGDDRFYVQNVNSTGGKVVVNVTR
jgi:hypothetical protein